MSTTSRHYIPQNTAQFREFLENLVSRVQANATAWGIPADRKTELADSLEHFVETIENYRIDTTPGNLGRRNDAQAAATAVVRALVNQFLRFPPVTNNDRIDMGIPNHDTVRTDHTVVTEMVGFEITLASVRQLVVDFWQEGADHKAKPAHYDGAVIIWGVMDTPPARPDELPHHIMASRRPFTLHFTEEERGRTIQMALCWQNERGIRGAWSDYQSAIIP